MTAIKRRFNCSKEGIILINYITYMQKKLKLAVMAMCCAPAAFAQTAKDSIGYHSEASSEAAFTFTEAQLGEDDDMTQNVTLVNSNTDIYASQVGYLFSPARFRYRAFDQKYNEVYLNGLPLNDMESGQFRYSQVGGLNNMTRNQEFALPFEGNNFALSGMGGSNNYNFRPSAMPVGHRVTLSGANRNYTLRGMYTYSTGLSEKGWAFTGGVSYRWANNGYVEGTFYNSLSYFLAVQKVMGKHSLSLSTWGNPTERSTQGPGTDEMYWLANNRYYNPNWGYQNGKKRNSRVVNDFAPSAILTWDWNFNENSKLTTSFFGKYSMYKSTKLNYNNSENPMPGYWKNLPSSYFDVWHETNYTYRTEQAFNDWQTAYEYWTASKANRQINWDRLYYANKGAAAQGIDALYYVQAKHNDNLMFSLASTFNHQIDKDKKFNVGLVAATNKAMHYQTMEDMLGATSFHNINSYAVSDRYTATSDQVQYDLNHPNALVKEGDRFGYDYNLLINKGKVWGSYTENFGPLNYTVAAKLGYTSMQRDGKMRHGMYANNSYGKSKTAEFVDGGFKFGSNLNLGRGSVLTLGLGYEHRAPEARTAFMAPEMNNDFVENLKNERIFSSELGYMYENSWLHLNVKGYYSRMTNVSDWQNFFNDDVNSFTYVSLTDMKKEYYGVELGAKFKVTSFLDVKLLGTISEAKIINNAKLKYVKSTNPDDVYGDNRTGDYNDHVYNKGMRDGGTPLTAASLGVSYHQKGWFIDLNCNYYDRIYLSYSPNFRFQSTIYNRNEAMKKLGQPIINDVTGEVIPGALDQTKGKGGFMLDGSIGRSIYLKHGSLSINLSVTNILNNRDIVTGGFEQSRSGYSGVKTQKYKPRGYSFENNPYKFYVFGTNGMLNITYKF